MDKTLYYIANTGGQHVLATFDLATEAEIRLNISHTSANDSFDHEVRVVHDGIATKETQESLAAGNTIPDEITTLITNATGYVVTTPSRVPSVYNIDYKSVEANLYAQHTRSGKQLRTMDGAVIYLANNSNNMTIRQGETKYFGNSSTYMSDNTLGPIASGDELFVVDDLQSFGDSTIDNLVIASSGQVRNCQYLELAVNPGQVYQFSANAFFEFAPVYAKTTKPAQYPSAFIKVGTTVAGDEIVSQSIAEDAETSYQIRFVPTTSTVYLSLGFGAVGTSLTIKNPTLKRLVPFHTFNQATGSFGFVWPGVAGPNTISILSNNSITINASNNVYINSVNCGPQIANNYLTFTYFANGQVNWALNGTASVGSGFQSNTISVTANVPMHFITYYATALTDLELLSISNG